VHIVDDRFLLEHVGMEYSLGKNRLKRTGWDSLVHSDMAHFN
jgi:hypothetical protein